MSSSVFDLVVWTSALGDQLEDEVARLRAGIDDDRLDVVGPQRPGHVLDALVGGANDRVGRCIHRHAGIDPFESDRRWFVVVERLGYETRLALGTI
jgi:hypothetical protein